jgi:anaerobic C4-dicarboxylate transporter
MGGLGLFAFVFLFGLPPGSPPGTVLGMILAVITALSLMQAAGGLDYVIQLAEKVLRSNPRRITILAPLVTYFMILASGTQHVIYALLPVIAEVARKKKVGGFDYDERDDPIRKRVLACIAREFPDC